MTTTVQTTVTPTVYTELVTITAIPGPTYTIGDFFTTAVTDTETIVVPCSTYTVYSSEFFEALETSTYYVTFTQTQTASWLVPASTASSESPLVVSTTSSFVAPTTAPTPVTFTTTISGSEIVVVSTPDSTVTTDTTYYDTVECTSGGIYTVTGGVVTTVTADTVLAVATSAPAAKRLARRDEFVLNLPESVSRETEKSTKGKAWAISYSPYTDSGACKSSSDIASDIKMIASKGFRSVRIYSTDCESLSTVGETARDNGLYMILGLSINESGIEDHDVQLEELSQFSHWDIVDMVVVGNEAIFNEFCTAEDLALHITQVRSALRIVGYQGPVTTAETIAVLQSNRDILCPVIDAVGVNVHPFFDAGVSPSEAGSFVKQNMLLAQSACASEFSNSKLPVVILETGWPSAGTESNGAAVPGKAEQLAAIESIKAETNGGVDVVFFTFADDLWKLAGLFGVEQRFGLVDLF